MSGAFAMLGADDAAVCEGDACALPAAGVSEDGKPLRAEQLLP